MTRFDVVIQGFKLNGAEPLSRVLERVLGCSVDEAKALGKRFPSVVRRELEPAQATALAEVLRAAGARIELVESGSAPTAAVAAAAQAVSAEQAAPRRESAAGKYLLGTLKIMLSGPPPRPPEAKPAVLSADVAPSARGSVPVPKRESLVGKYVMGTLRIALNGPPPPPEPVAAKPEPAGPAPTHEVGVLDDVLNPTGGGAALEIDEGALHARNYVSGGRADVQRPSLMMRMVDIPARVVRRARAKDPEEEAQVSQRARWLIPALVACGAILIVGASVTAVSHPSGGSRVEAQSVGSANGNEALPPGEQQQGDEKTSSQDEGGANHPLLRIAPKPMEASLASILRRQIPGTSGVAIEWPAGEKPEGSVQCMVVSGTSSQREERVAALLNTGKRISVSPTVASQMRDHSEVLRAADNSPNAQYTMLCLQN
jgi:hypothetical protein